MTTLVDVHCHLDYDDFTKDLDNFIENIEKAKIKAISNTVNPQNYKETKKLYEKTKNVEVIPGLYPQEAEKISEKDFNNYLEFLRKNKDEFIAIGEIGLDKHHTKEENLFEIQVSRFRKLIELGIELDKPLIIHTRKAESIVINIIREYVEKTEFKKFNLHCFMGKKKLIKEIKELQIYCSIPLVVENTQSFQILVSELPVKQLLVETDSPYLNPDKERNSPLNIPRIYDKIAEIKGLDKTEIKSIIYRNYMRLFM